MDKSRYTLAPIAENRLPLPTEELMQYGIDNDVLDSPWLMMHVILSRIVTLSMIKKMKEGNHGNTIDENVAMALNTVYHATRQRADFGREGKKSEEINAFMQDHDDMDFALKQAIEHRWGDKKFDEGMIKGIKDYRRNPRTRTWYFPQETLEKDWIIDRTETIPLLTSRLIAWPICSVEDRFLDLRTRRSEEIWKPELDYIIEQLQAKKDIRIAEPLLETAKQDTELAIHNEEDLKNLIVSWKIDSKKMWVWMLDGYEERCKKAIAQFCEICHIDNFHARLKSDVQVVKDETKVASMEDKFKTYLWRDLKSDEFIPHLPGIDIIYKRISRIKAEMQAIQKINKWSAGQLMDNLHDEELIKHEKKLKEYQENLKSLMIDVEKVVKKLQPK